MVSRGIVGTLALFVALAAPAAAQNVQTTGDIRGRTLDAAGEPVPGVLVTARSTETGLERTAITAENGIYVLRLLPPSTYTVTAEALGFGTEAAENVRVAIGASSPVNFTLSPQAVEIEELVVTGERAPIDVSDASVTELVTVEQIENLPALGRDFTDFIALSSQVAVDPGVTTGGQFSIGGMSASQTNLQIDGVDANNAFFGENRGGARIPFVFSLESIEEFQIITNGYDVEYGAYSGGIVNVVTRSGTNDFEGTVYGNFRNDALTGRGFLNEQVDDYSVQQFAGRVSGPIVRDNAFFLVSADVQRRREPQLPVTLGRYADDPVAAAELQRFWGILENTYGISNPAQGYESFSTTNDVLSLFGRVDWNITDQHRLSVRHNFTTYTNDNEFDPGFDDYYGQSRSETLSDDSHSFTAELSSVFDQNTFNVLRFAYATEERPRNASELRPALITTLSNGDLIAYGGTFVAFHNYLEENKYQLIDNFTRVFGDHTVKVGAQGLFTTALNDFLPPLTGACGRGSQGGGIFCFDDLDALEAGIASSYQFNVQPGGDVVPHSEVGLSELAFYIQDEFAVTPKLTVTAGLRHDRQWFDDNPGRVLDIERAFGFPSSTAPTDDDNISPRLSIAYDLNGDGSSVVRAGAGYFFGRVPLVLGGNVLGSQRPVLTLTCTGDVGADPANPIEPDAPPSPLGYPGWSEEGFDNPTSCRPGQASQLTGTPSYTIWHEDFEYPETFKANVGYEGFISDNTRLAVDLIFSRSTNMFTVRNLNLQDVQFTLANEGREIYTPAGSFGPGAANTLGSRVYTDIGDVYVNYNDGRAQAFSATVEAQHNLTDNLRFRGAYTWTHARDNASLFCCTSSSNFSDPMIGAFGPNDLGGFGDEERGWGPSDFSRDHAFVFSGFADLPFDIEVAAFWRIQSGRPFTPEVSGDINGDGVRFNDRPYVFSVADVPLAAADGSVEEFEARQAYASVLANNECLSEHVGGIIPRNTCRTPWLNLLDMRVTKYFETFGDQRAELQVDLFNVVNGIGSLFCSDADFEEDPSAGACGWGRVTTVSGADRNIYGASSYDAASNTIRYTVNESFGRESVVGDGLLMQFQAQIGFKYYF